ncbi:MAG: hypothetical protein MUF29_07415 [Chitinophagaceae bacterium]|jgi:hypothetical protein|nr:hypothetical protein [Chitinophagaceae bacterium]
MPNPSSQQRLQELLHEQQELVTSSPEWYRQLKEAVNQLIQEDFDGLLQLLYRVDVSESRLRQMLQQLPGSDAAEIITNLLLERQLQKIKSRRDHAQRDESIPDDERW